MQTSSRYSTPSWLDRGPPPDGCVNSGWGGTDARARMRWHLVCRRMAAAIVKQQGQACGPVSALWDCASHAIRAQGPSSSSTKSRHITSRHSRRGRNGPGRETGEGFSLSQRSGHRGSGTKASGRATAAVLWPCGRVAILERRAYAKTGRGPVIASCCRRSRP